jgi:hypothetical protein
LVFFAAGASSCSSAVGARIFVLCTRFHI